MNIARWTGRVAIPLTLLVLATPAFGERAVLLGVGPDIGLWDVADGHHTVGSHARAMLYFGADNGTIGVRFDGTYSNFLAEGDAGNEDYSVLAFFANMVVTFAQDATKRPYWTFGVGYDDASGADEGSGVVLGTGVGLRFGWGVIEARFDIASTSSGRGAHVPIFAAVRF